VTAHNPSNPLCDKNEYGEMDGVRCTCDVDVPDEGNVRPSTVVDDGMAPDAGRPSAQIKPWVRPTQGPGPATGPAAHITLEGHQAMLHLELEHASRAYDAARRQLAPAEVRWRKAMDAYMEALLGR
jgi:hypothetical protein